MNQATETEQTIYQGQFGDFTITSRDRQGVILYRAMLVIAALSFALGSGLILWLGPQPWLVRLLTPLYTCFSLALGGSLLLIHIYMVALHRALQGFWLIGSLAAIGVAHFSPAPFGETVYLYPISLLGVGFTFAALTGIFFKEAFCFNRLETKVLTPLVPLLLLGHLTGLLPLSVEKVLLGLWAGLFLVFAMRKTFQPIPADIGDKSVFEYLKRRAIEPQDA